MWLCSDRSGCIREKVVVFGKRWLCSGEVVVIGQNWLYSDKTGFIRAKWFYSGKLVVFGQSSIRFYTVLYGQRRCIREKWLYSGKGGCIRAKVVVFG